jgi:hypothetical protein
MSLEIEHLLVYLEWRTLLSKVFYRLKNSKEEQNKYVHYLANHVINSVCGNNDMRDVFPIMHSKCCNGTKLGCKQINQDTEKKVILLLDEYYNDKDTLINETQYNPESLRRARTQLKKLQTDVDHFALRLIKNYMRMAIWKEHLSYPLTILENFLCCKEGLMAIGLGCVPGVWTLYGNLKKLPICCYKRRVCRQCFCESAKLVPCRDCGCVYFCKQGSCQSNARSDPYYGHTQEECALFRNKL